MDKGGEILSADGTITFRVDADDKSAQDKLKQLRRDIDKTARALDKSNETRSGIATSLQTAREEAAKTAAEIERLKAEYEKATNVGGTKTAFADPLKYLAGLDKQPAITSELSKQEALYAKQQAAVEKLEGKEQAVLQTIQEQTAKLEEQRAAAGEVEGVLAQESAGTMPQLHAMTEQVSKSMSKGFKNILKWGFGIRSVFVLFRRLKSYIKEAVTAFAAQDAETQASINSLRSALAQLKLSWGAAFAPVLNSVVPLLQTLISWLNSLANAINTIFSIVSGKSTIKKAVKNNEALAGSFGGAGDAAEKAEKQIMGFDEINKLTADHSGGGGGGGGGGGAFDIEEEAIDMESMTARLGLSMRDVLFDWDDLTPEQIVEKCISSLLTIGGAALGFMTIGGVKGILIGAVAGLAFSLLLNATVFNFDGKVDWHEIAKMLVIAIFGVAGVLLLGATPLGWLVGLTIGLAVGLSVVSIDWDNVKNSLKNWWDEHFGKYIQQWKEMGSKESNEVGFYIVAGFIEGLYRGAVGIGKWIYSHIIQPVIEFFRNGFQVGSPSKVMIEIGEFVMEGLLLGMMNVFTKLWEWLSDMFNKIVQGFINAGNRIWTFVSGITSTISNLWRNMTTNISVWTGSALEAVRNYFSSTFSSAVDSVKNAIDRIKKSLDIKLRFPHITLPHISVTYTPARSAFAKFFGVSEIPHVSVQWYARGGIVDGSTLIGAGEAGKEAIIPLERHTEWINMVADSLVDRLLSSNRLADLISGAMLPALASGEFAPPRALSSSGSAFSDGDIQRLVSGIVSAFSEAGPNEQVTRLYLDGRQIAESVTKHQRQMQRGYGT